MKNYSSYFIAIVLIVASITVPAAAQQVDADQATAENVKIKVAKLGVGEKAKATAFLKNGTKVKGYIAQAGSDDFVLRDRKSDAPTTIRYNDVSKLDSNRGHSTARNVAIGVGIGVGAVLAVIGITIAHLD